MERRSNPERAARQSLTKWAYMPYGKRRRMMMQEAGQDTLNEEELAELDVGLLQTRRNRNASRREGVKKQRPPTKTPKRRATSEESSDLDTSAKNDDTLDENDHHGDKVQEAAGSVQEDVNMSGVPDQGSEEVDIGGNADGNVGASGGNVGAAGGNVDHNHEEPADAEEGNLSLNQLVPALVSAGAVGGWRFLSWYFEGQQ